MSKKFLVVLLAVVLMVCSFGSAMAADALKVALVLPSTINDYAFSQSMYEALKTIQGEYGEDKFEIAYSESLGDPTAAEEAIRDYADSGYNIVIAHGSQYGTKIQAIAPDYPDTIFAWGNGTDTYGLKNVYAYNAEAQQGGYVFGFVASKLSKSGIVGACGPVESGDAKSYIDGFVNGAIAAGLKADNVRKTYTGSFGDVSLMNAAAKTHIDEGADVLTGTSQAVPGAISAVQAAGKQWLGVQYDTIPLGPDVVVASLVYDWTPMLKKILDAREKGVLGGEALALNFNDNGFVIKWNDAIKTDQSIKDAVDAMVADIVAGKIDPLAAK